MIPSIRNTIPIVTSDCWMSKLTPTIELSELSTATFAAASPPFLIVGSRSAAKRGFSCVAFARLPKI